MRLLKEGVNSVAVVCLILTVFLTGIVSIQGRPLIMLLRHTMLAMLGAPTPGLTVNGDNDTLVCNENTGECTWE